MAFNKKGPNNYAHWNMFPFMTTPKTKYILGQTQSPFFRLPREIRDTIYEYYAQGRPRYVYDKDTAKLRYPDASAQTEGLGLIMICKIAADEMKHVAFQTIEFSTLCSANDGAEFQQLRSRVARFSQLFEMVQTQRQYMLICVAELLEESDFANVRARFPVIEDSFGRPLQEAVAQNLEKLSGNMAISLDDHTSQDFIDALVFILDIAKNRNPTKFVQLTRQVFGNNTCHIENLHGSVENNIFVEGSLHDVFSWRPEPWSIPTDRELSRMEKLVCEPEGDRTLLYEWCHVTNPIRLSNNKYYFSAAAVAIDFLSHIPQKRLKNLRKLIICEDFKSRPRSVCHARGLIPICRANPNLRIERHINLLDSLLPVDQPNGYRGGRSSIGGFNVMEAAVPWFAEIPLLRTHGMPEGSFQLVIDGTSREALEVWNVIKHAAAMQGAMLEQCRVRNTHPTSRLYDSIAGRIYGPTALPWHLPDGFSDTIRRTIEGTTNITFTGDVGELWDEDVFYFQRRDWTLDQWRHEWRNEIIVKSIDTDFWKRSNAWYQIDPRGFGQVYRTVYQGEVIRSSDRPL